MSTIDPAKMALQIAGLRANETYLPREESEFQDPYAEYFFPPEAREMLKDPNWVKAERARYEKILPGVNGAIVARIKFMDACLMEAIAATANQLVIIGAGYDSRAYRIEGVSKKMTVFEVDHPATQAVKIKTIGEIFGKMPRHVIFVPMRFGEDTLDEKLLESGYQPDLRTLFIIEGLLMYIPSAAVDSLLAFIANASAAGSTLVCDFFDTTVVEGTSPLQEAKALRRFVETEGAPLRFGIPHEEVESFFKQRGYQIIRHLDAVTCKQEMFTPGNDDRPVSQMFRFVHAAVR